MKKNAGNNGTVSPGRSAWMIISCIAAFCILLMAALSSSVLKSEAKVNFLMSPDLLIAGDYTESPAMADLLNIVYSGDIDLMDGSTEYIYPIGSVMDNNKMFSVYQNNGSRISGYQCYIYANAVYCKLFGEYVGHGTGLSNSENVITNAGEASYELFKEAGVMCGAYMRTTARADGAYDGRNGHSLVIMKYDENEVTYIEGNGEGQGLVRGAILSWSDFNARQITGRNRRICHVTQPKKEYYESLYGDSYVSVRYSKGISDAGTAPSSLRLKYRQSFTVPDNGTLYKGEYNFIGWYCQRTDNGLIANVKGGWSTPDEIEKNYTQKRTFRSGEVLNFDSYFYMSGGVHMKAMQEIVFYPIWDAPPAPRPEGPFTLTSSYNASGEYVDFYIEVTKNPGVSYLEMTLDYPDDLVVLNYENGNVLGGLYAGDVYDVISWRMAGDLFGTGRLLKVSFRSLSGNISGKTVSFNILSCCGEPGDVEYEILTGTVTID